MSPALENKVAIVTGAGSGLGKAFALRYAAEGAKLLLPDLNLERAENTAGEIRAQGGEAVATLTDISDEDATRKMAEEVIRRYGRVDILLNNAAWIEGVEFKPYDALTVADWDRMFAVNTRGTWLCCKAIGPLMEKQSSGKIINIVSNTIKMSGAQGLLHYICSKAAVATMTQCLARTLGQSGINVNAIAPGATATKDNLARPGIAKNLERLAETLPIRRREEPEDLVGTAVFLASSDADMITGQIIYVDGGLVMP